MDSEFLSFKTSDELESIIKDGAAKQEPHLTWFTGFVVTHRPSRVVHVKRSEFLSMLDQGLFSVWSFTDAGSVLPCQSGQAYGMIGTECVWCNLYSYCINKIQDEIIDQMIGYVRI